MNKQYKYHLIEQDYVYENKYRLQYILPLTLVNLNSINNHAIILSREKQSNLQNEHPSIPI